MPNWRHHMAGAAPGCWVMAHPMVSAGGHTWALPCLCLGLLTCLITFNLSLTIACEVDMIHSYSFTYYQMALSGSCVPGTMVDF